MEFIKYIRILIQLLTVMFVLISSTSFAYNKKELIVGALIKSQYYTRIIDNQTNKTIGFDYSIIKDFANKYGYKLKFINFNSLDKLLQALEKNEVNVAIGGLNLEADFDQKFATSLPYSYSQAAIISPYTDRTNKSIDNINNKIVAPKHYSIDKDIINNPNIKIEYSTKSVESLLLDVAANKIPYLLINEINAMAIRQVDPKIQIKYSVGKPQPIVFYLNKNYKNTLKDINKYLNLINTHKFIHSMRISFFNPLVSFHANESRIFVNDMNSKFIKYAPIFKKTATDIDWRIAMAIGYQESRWNPKAISPWGPSGLMMLTNKSAKILKVKNKLDAKESITAGTGFLNSTRKSLLPELKDENRDFFTVAIYNMGLAKVIDARKFLTKINKDNTNWVNLAESYEEIGRHSHNFRYGKVDGIIAGNYLRGVRKYQFMINNYLLFVKDPLKNNSNKTNKSNKI